MTVDEPQHAAPFRALRWGPPHALVAAAVGVAVLAGRDGGSEPGRTGIAALAAIGMVVFALPFAFAVHWRMRRGHGRLAVAVVSIAAAAFLATRPAGRFVQTWFVFTLAASCATLWLTSELGDATRRRVQPTGSPDNRQR